MQPPEQNKRGLQLDRVVLLGRTLEEYSQFFDFDPAAWTGRNVLDVASGVSSFTAEANERGINVTAFDPIYSLDPDVIEARCEPDLESVFQAVKDLPTYRWTFYRDRLHMREFRERAYKRFLQDYRTSRDRYIPGLLPKLPFSDSCFDVVLVSYFLFAYHDQFTYEFHRDSIAELARVSRGEVRIYPLVTFEAEQSAYVPLLSSDPALEHLKLAIIPTQFEFLINSNSYLRVTHA